MKTFIFCLLFLLSFNLFARPIEFVVPTSPGGPTDSTVRRIVDILEKNSDLKFLVLNRPGAAKQIAYNYIIETNKPSLILTTPEIRTSPAINHVNTLYTIGNFHIKFVSNKSKIKNYKDFSEIANTREVVFGNSGIGTYSYIGMEFLCKNINCLSVQYRSGMEGLLGVMSNQIDAYALVSYGSKSALNNERLTVFHELRDKNFTISIYSKNLDKKTEDLIKEILNKQLTDEFYKEMDIDKP